MSKPKAPYYYKKSEDVYHWEKSCYQNMYSEYDEEWIRTYKQPKDREQCNQCKSKGNEKG